MISTNEFKAIAALDLDPIKVKLMHKESGEAWTLEYANAMEFEYRRFLYLMKMFPNEPAAPLFDVDIFWHYHILDTMKYAVDCEKVFGYFLHHFPYLGLRDAGDEVTHQRAGVRMQELYEGTFGEPFLRAMPDGAGTSPSGFSYAVGQQAVAAAGKTAFSYAVGQEAVAAAGKTAFSYSVGQEAVAAAGKTAFSYAVGQEAMAAAGKTAFSYAVGQEAVACARKTAFSYAVGQEVVAGAAQTLKAVDASEPSADLAALRRLYFERPVLATA